MPVNTEEKRFSTAEMQRTLEDRKRRHKRQAVTGVCVCTALLLPCIIVLRWSEPVSAAAVVGESAGGCGSGCVHCTGDFFAGGIKTTIQRN